MTNPASAVAGAAPPKIQGNCEVRSAIYATAAEPIFGYVFFTSPRWVPVSNCFNDLLRALTKNSLEDCMSKFHLVKKWWDLENRDFGVYCAFSPAAPAAAAASPDTVPPIFFEVLIIVG